MPQPANPDIKMDDTPEQGGSTASTSKSQDKSARKTISRSAKSNIFLKNKKPSGNASGSSPVVPSSPRPGITVKPKSGMKIISVNQGSQIAHQQEQERKRYEEATRKQAEVDARRAELKAANKLKSEIKRANRTPVEDLDDPDDAAQKSGVKRASEGASVDDGGAGQKRRPSRAFGDGSEQDEEGDDVMHE